MANRQHGSSIPESAPAASGLSSAQGVASMTTRKQVAIVMLTMFALFAVGQLLLWTLPLAGR
jgi:hypothetical protein